MSFNYHMFRVAQIVVIVVITALSVVIVRSCTGDQPCAGVQGVECVE